MPPRDDLPFNSLLQQARNGDPAALGRLLDSYRSYLTLIAGSMLRNASRTSVDLSDVVQETNARAYIGFPAFQGHDEPTLVAWLRAILCNHARNVLANQNRPGRRPESIDALLERASEDAHRALAAPGSTPSASIQRREQAVLTANALDALEPRHKQILILCYLDKLPHKDVARQMQLRSEGASRMLLMRAATALEKKLQERP